MSHDDLTKLMAAGNIAYARGDMKDTERALDILSLLEQTPDHGMRMKIVIAVIRKERGECSIAAMKAILARE